MKKYRILSVVCLTFVLTSFTMLTSGCRIFGVRGNGKVIKQEEDRSEPLAQ